MVEAMGPKCISLSQMTHLRSVTAVGRRDQDQAALVAGSSSRPASPKRGRYYPLARHGVTLQSRPQYLQIVASPVLLRLRPRSARGTFSPAAPKRARPTTRSLAPTQRAQSVSVGGSSGSRTDQEQEAAVAADLARIRE